MPYDVVAFSTDEDAYLWTNQEEGAFHRLMRHAWINGGIPDDMKKIAGICREPVKVMQRLWLVLEKKWPVDPMQPDRRINPKQESEREFKEEKSGKAKESAVKRWEKERAAKASAKQVGPTTTDAMRTHSEGNAPLPSPPLSASASQKLDKNIPAFGVDVFERVWASYPNRDGRKEALRHFNATVKTPEDLERILSALESYKAHLALHPLKPPKNGSTWFNNWRDWYGWVEPARNGSGTPAEEQRDLELVREIFRKKT